MTRHKSTTKEHVSQTGEIPQEINDFALLFSLFFIFKMQLSENK